MTFCVCGHASSEHATIWNGQAWAPGRCERCGCPAYRVPWPGRGATVKGHDLLVALERGRAAHGLERERALLALRHLALRIEADAWAAWARTELRRAG